MSSLGSAKLELWRALCLASKMDAHIVTPSKWHLIVCCALPVNVAFVELSNVSIFKWCSDVIVTNGFFSLAEMGRKGKFVVNKAADSEKADPPSRKSNIAGNGGNLIMFFLFHVLQWMSGPMKMSIHSAIDFWRATPSAFSPGQRWIDDHQNWSWKLISTRRLSAKQTDLDSNGWPSFNGSAD